MPLSDFTEDDPRLIVGRLFLRDIQRATEWLSLLETVTDTLLEIRQLVIDNDPPIFQPDDLPYVNTQLMILRDAIQDYVDSLPGGPPS